MNKNEKIYVSGFWCKSAEDRWETGEDPSSAGPDWSMKDIDFDAGRGFDTVGKALAAVCEANCFKYDKGAWTDFGRERGGEYGRFDRDVLVNWLAVQASPREIEAWKKGEQRLWNCHIVVRLEVRAARPFGPGDEVRM